MYKAPRVRLERRLLEEINNHYIIYSDVDNFKNVSEMNTNSKKIHITI